MSERDRLEIDALVSDHYLDSLLAARDRRPAPIPDEGLDPGVRAAADTLAAQLARVHPSFHFEERLATDLQASVTRSRRGGRATRPSVVRRLEPRATAAQRHAGRTGGHGVVARGGPVARPLLIGGALTSAAISIAGAYVAWRRGRPVVHPMARAVRAAHQTGLTRGIPAGAARLAIARTQRHG